MNASSSRARYLAPLMIREADESLARDSCPQKSATASMITSSRSGSADSCATACFMDGDGFQAQVEVHDKGLREHEQTR